MAEIRPIPGPPSHSSALTTRLELGQMFSHLQIKSGNEFLIWIQTSPKFGAVWIKGFDSDPSLHKAILPTTWKILNTKELDEHFRTSNWVNSYLIPKRSKGYDEGFLFFPPNSFLITNSESSGDVFPQVGKEIGERGLDELHFFSLLVSCYRNSVCYQRRHKSCQQCIRQTAQRTRSSRTHSGDPTGVLGSDFLWNHLCFGRNLDVRMISIVQVLNSVICVQPH